MANGKNTLGIEFHEVGFIRTFWVGFSQQRKKPGWRRSSNCVQNSFFRLSPSGQNEKAPLDRIQRVWYHTTILGELLEAAKKAGLTKVVQLRSKLVFSTFPIGAKRKNTLWIEFHEVGFIRPSWVGFSQQRKKPGWRGSSNCVQNSFFRLSPSGQIKRKTTLGSNSTSSLSYHHFGRALPRSGKRRVDEKRPIALKTRFFEFPHMGETKKHPWDRIPPGRFHTTILGGLYQAAENAGMTKFFQLGWKLVLSSFPIGTKQKNTLGIEFHEVGFIPTFLLGPCKQCKKAGWRRSSICLENSFFRLSPSERNEKTPLGSNSTRSVSYHHFGLVLPSRGKRRVDEGRPIAFKTRFFDFPHRGQTKKHPWDRFPRGRFHTTIFGGLYEAAENAGMTKSFQLGWKLVFSTFPIGAKRKNTLGIEFHEVGFTPPFWVGLTKQRKKPGWRRCSSWVENSFCRVPPSGGNKKKTIGIEFHEVGFIPPFFLRFCMQSKKPGWRRSSNYVENSFRRVSPSGRNEKTPLGSNSTRSVSYHYFCWALPSSRKRWVDEGRPIAFKTRFVEFPHRGETKKHPWVRIPRGRFHTTIFAGLYQAAENAGLTKVVQLRSKLVLSSFPIGAKRKNTLEIEFHEVGFIPPFWVGFTKERKTPGWRRSSNCVENSFFRVSPYGRIEKTPFGSNSTRSVSHHHFGWAFPSNAKSRVDEGRPIAFKTRFFDFPHRGETKKHHWVRIPGGRFHTPIFAGLYQAAENAGLTNVVQLRSKLVLSSFPIGAKRKNTLVIEFHEVGFIPPFWVGFSKQRKTPVWPRSSNWVENSFCRVSPSGRNKKTPLGSNSTRSVSYHHFCWAFARCAKRRVDECRPIALKTRVFEFSHRGETKKHPLDRIPRGRLHTTILGGLFPAAQNAGLTKVVQLRSKLVFLRFPIGAKRKNTLGIEFHELSFKPQFWVGFCKQRKKPAV